MRGTIYLITNKVNGKQYIGQTRAPLPHRWYQHGYASRKSPQVIHMAMRKYGVENFVISQLCTCPSEDLDEMEAIFIEEYGTLCPSGYNVRAGGHNHAHVRPGKRRHEEDSQLPLYVKRLRDATRNREGYRVNHGPSGQSANFCCMQQTMEKKLQQALQFLKQAKAGRARRAPKVFKTRDLPPYVFAHRKKWIVKKKGHDTVRFTDKMDAIEYAKSYS